MPRDYTRQGDPFTRKVEAGQGPRTACALRNKWTGREYARRVNVRECYSLGVPDLRAAASADLTAADTLERYGARVYWHPETRTAALLGQGQDLPENMPEGGAFLTFRLEPRGKARRDGTRGRAVFLACPHCGRSVLTVYVSPWGQWGERVPGGVWGCVRCLGLTYPSSQEHRTPSGDGRLLRVGPFSRWQRTRRGQARERAFRRFLSR